MDNLLCTGKEKELADCRFDGWGKSDCEPSEAAGVICKGLEVISEAPTSAPKIPKFKINSKEPMEIRLVGGRVRDEGRVEVGLHIVRHL